MFLYIITASWRPGAALPRVRVPLPRLLAVLCAVLVLGSQTLAHTHLHGPEEDARGPACAACSLTKSQTAAAGDAAPALEMILQPLGTDLEPAPTSPPRPPLRRFQPRAPPGA
jgi:hypothetical protein